MSINKVEVFITTDSGELTADSVTITNSINDIPTAVVSAKPKTIGEIIDINSKNFSTGTITVSINGSKKVMFSGTFMGAQSSIAASSVNCSLYFYGGLYKLSQLSVSSPGLHTMGASSLLRASINKTQNSLKELSILIGSDTTLVKLFQNAMKFLFSKVLAGINFGKADSTNISKVSNEIFKGLSKLYDLHSTTNTSVVDTELKKIKELPGLNATFFQTTRQENIIDVLQLFLAQPETTFWDMLIGLCESYQVNIGNHRDQIFMFPNNPVGKVNLEISPSDVQNMTVGPLPMNIPTRCYFGTKDNVSIGTFPKLDSDGLTELEKKLGTIRVLYYDSPNWAIYNNPILTKAGQTASEQNNTKREVYSKFAHMYFLKECLKHRTGSLTLKFSPDIVIGSVIKFVDPFFGFSYQGYVQRINHTINSNSIFTNLDLSYIIEDKEKSSLGTKDFVDNPLYPDFSNTSLNSLV